MTEADRIARQLQDRAQITDLIHTYASAADAKDFDRLLAIFADDARLESAAGVRDGIDAIRASFSPAGLAASRAASSGLQFDRSSHLMANTIVTFEGEADAHAESSCVVYLVGAQDGREMMVTRGITYSDDFVRLPQGWRLRRRVHRAVWQHGPAPL